MNYYAIRQEIRDWDSFCNQPRLSDDQAKRLKVATVLLLERLRLTALHGATDPRTVAMMHKANVAELQFEHGGII